MHKEYKELVKEAFENDELSDLVVGLGKYFQHDYSHWNPAPLDDHEVKRYLPDIRKYVAENPSALNALEEALSKLAQRGPKSAYAAFIFIYDSDFKNTEELISDETESVVIDGIVKFKDQLSTEKLFKEDTSPDAETKLEFIRRISGHSHRKAYERLQKIGS